MRIEPIGRILDASAASGWAASHAAYPSPLRLPSGLVRVYFVARDALQRGQLGWCDLAPDDPTRVLAVSPAPVLAPGEAGAFDDAGISPGNIVQVGETFRLYYTGWNRGVSVPFRNAIGLAVSRDGATFERAFPGPLLDRSRTDAFSISYPFVSKESAGWRMYYGTHRGSGRSEATMCHVITDSTSEDGIEWRPSGVDVIRLAPNETAVARPWVTHGSPDMMFFTSYGRRCRIAVAERLSDGSWQRVHDDCVPLSQETWADREVCYPAHIEIDGRHLLFYCGNDYGRSGFGVARICL